MGALWTKIMDLFGGMQDARLLMLGLDAAGKTTILYKLKLGEILTTTPTVGFNVEVVEYNNLRLTVWDLGGQEKLRKLWHHSLLGTQALIFVIDSSDRDRIEEAQEELQHILSTEEMKDVAVLVYANKQDLPHSMSTEELAQKLMLHDLKHKRWHIQPTCATAGDGLMEGLDWLAKELSKR